MSRQDYRQCSPMPWRIDIDNAKELKVVDARGETVYYEDWGCIPDEMPAHTAEEIVRQARANAFFMVDMSAKLVSA